MTIQEDLVAYKNLTVLGTTTLMDTNVAGDLSVGLMTFNGADNSINSVGSVLKLQDIYGAGNIEAFGGKVIMTTNGDILADSGKISAKEVVAGAFTVKVPVDVPNIDTLTTQEEIDAAVESALPISQQSTIGSSKIPVGETRVEILSEFVDENTKIFVTPTSTTYGQSLIVSEKSAGKFVVEMDSSALNDITFDYWIVKTEKQISQAQ
jgi:hypothetical protein